MPDNRPMTKSYTKQMLWEMCPLRYFSERLKTLALCRDLSMSKRLRRTCFVDLNTCLSKDFNKGFRQQQKDQKGTVVVQSLSEMSRACWEIFLGWLRASRYGNDADTAAGWKVHQLVRRFSQQTSIYRLFIVDVPIFSRGSLPEIAIFFNPKNEGFCSPTPPPHLWIPVTSHEIWLQYIASRYFQKPERQ